MDENPNIYVIGAQCTGKTTLVDALQVHFNQAVGTDINRPGVIKEVARTVLKQSQITTEDIRSCPKRSLDLQWLILRAQVDAENTALRSRTWFISDRSGVDPIVYASRHVNSSAAESMLLSVEWKQLKDRMKRSVIIVCEAGVDWLVDDGTRLMPEDGDDWLSFHQMFCDFLERAQLEYVVLPRDIRDLKQRVAFVLSRVAQARLHGDKRG